MSVTIISKKINARMVTIKLVDGSLVKGKINLHRNDVDIQRVSDLFTKVDEPFIVVFDAEVEGQVERVIILNKISIVWVLPEDGHGHSEKTLQDEEKPEEVSKGSLLDRLRSS